MDIKDVAASPESFAERIRRLRQQRGLSLRTLGAAVGVSAPAVARWEQGSATPRRSLRAPLADALAVSEFALFWQESDKRHLSDVISEAKDMVAAAAGTTRDRVTITIEVWPG